jgi:hypothetical protein
MPGFFEKFLRDETGSLRVGEGPEKILERENLEGILDKFLENLKITENKNIIDQIMYFGFTAKLSEDIQMTRDILEKTGLLVEANSSGKELLRNIETVFTRFLRKAREKGAGEYEEVIREECKELESFFNLAINCSEFREKEFGSASGYLTEEESKASGVNLRLSLAKYLVACEEKFKKRSN